jgi:uncharacterized membrane protein
MNIKYESNVKATISFLKLLNVKVNNSTVDDTLQNHPDWPSLLCISDSLNLWNVPNAAGKIEAIEIDLLPTPFMAYTSSIENPLEIVKEVLEGEIILYSQKNGKQIIENKTSFLKRWNGIYLIAEKTEKSGEKDFKLNKKKTFIKRLIPISLCVLTTIITFLFLNKNLETSKLSNDFSIYFQYVILMFGVFVTTLLLWYEIDNDNPLLHKVCTGVVKGNCDAILNSNQSKVFNWLSWSEVGFFYFTGGLITFLFATPLNNSIIIIGYLNILALPYTIFSIYYQSYVAKQWCILCLLVQSLLVFGGVNIIANNLLVSTSHIPINFFVKSLLFYFLPVIAWYTIKPYLLKLQVFKNTKREFLRIKFNPNIFESLLKKQKRISVSTENIGINLGNPIAENTLIKVCSPYCGHCSKAHPKIEKLIEEVPNLKVKIIYTTANEPTLDSYRVVNCLMGIAADKNEKNIRKALDDWYLDNKKDCNQFIAKYSQIEEAKEQGHKIDAMFNWCESVEIKYTPTFFLNGYELPESYNIEDLQYFLNDDILSN